MLITLNGFNSQLDKTIRKDDISLYSIEKSSEFAIDAC